MWFKKKNPSQALKDKEALRKLGYIQELDRNMGVFSNFAISFSVISILTGLNTLYGYGLQHGGITSIWTFPIVGIFQVIVVLSLAEIASIYPVAGGVYKWTTIFTNKTIGWFCGWISLIGWIACTAGIDYGLGQFLASFLNIDKEDSISILMLVGAIVFIHSILSSYGIKLVRWFCDSSAIIHFIGVIIIVAILLTFGKQNTFSQISFESFYNSGFTMGALFQTFLMSAWTLTGFDASANVSEESINPSFTVPVGMVLSVVMSVIFGSLLLLGLGMATADVTGTLASDQPAVIYVISQALGPVVSKYVVIIMIIAMFICGLAAQTLLIRIIYALARDNALPKSNILKIVSSTYEMPNFSILLAGTTTFILCIVATILSFDGSLPTLPIITALSILGIYSSHAITLASSLISMARGKVKKGVFNLGALSLPIKVIALFWTLFICLVVFYFNIISGLVLIVVMVGIILYYVLSMRHQIINDNITLSEEDLIRIERMRKAEGE